MAGGSGSILINGTITMLFSWSSTSYPASNNSYVTGNIKLSRTGSYDTFDNDNIHHLYFQVNGNNVVARDDIDVHVASPSVSYDGYLKDPNGNYTFGFWIDHDTNGTKSFTLTGIFRPHIDIGNYLDGGTNYAVSLTAAMDTIPRTSTIGTIANFNVEDSFSVPVTKYSESFVDDLEIKLGTTIIKTISNYTNSAAIDLTVDEILAVYRAQSAAELTSTFTFTITTKSGGSAIGSAAANGSGTSAGTIHIKIGEIWKRAVPYIHSGGAWKKAAAMIKSTDWKRGKA